ncbi:MAG TPA: cysteine--tRNA ligase [Thermoanaerobaculia bacterium]|nr:cysteine--tRNA ligase [Thermoanaerobaculia bacterium]HUM30905.1 cysteine--tRNA ligase [Thermoanaerobaculia bacterium]HXK69215.1 cysteine--tRNA ligase [Thermoanaerobaculia bacterium]
MTLSISNTLGRAREEFQPLTPGKVGLYTCGPTVYNYIHIGNLRTFIWEDVLRRTLEFLGYEVTHVMNITDIDDKTIRDSSAQGLSLKEFTDRYTEAFFEDIDLVGIKRAHVYPRATEHIDAMVDMIQKLEARGHTYRSGGSIYFKISTFPSYGKLSGIDIDSVQPGARVDHDEYEKADVRDFALWKETKEGEPTWETPLGPGRPGWHIECSAMSSVYLGDTFDIHTGAVDNIFPHHENEIAQAEGATGMPFVRYWLHAEHLIVDGEKMAKSKGNFYTLRDLTARGWDPMSIRYLLLSVPYRRKLNFTFTALDSAKKALERLDIFIRRLEEVRSSERQEGMYPEEACSSFLSEYTSCLENDINTAEALASLFNFVRKVNGWIDTGDLSAGGAALCLSTLKQVDTVLGILPAGSTESDHEIDNLVSRREEARKNRNFAEADEIRTRLDSLGIIVEDTPSGPRWRRKI